MIDRPAPAIQKHFNQGRSVFLRDKRHLFPRLINGFQIILGKLDSQVFKQNMMNELRRYDLSFYYPDKKRQLTRVVLIYCGLFGLVLVGCSTF